MSGARFGVLGSGKGSNFRALAESFAKAAREFGFGDATLGTVALSDHLPSALEISAREPQARACRPRPPSLARAVASFSPRGGLPPRRCGWS